MLKCEMAVSGKGTKGGISVNWQHFIFTNTTAGANCGVGDTVVKYR